MQQVNVGNPLPFAGYSDSIMQSTGVGVMQELPWPGKLKLRGQIATRQAAIAGQSWRATRRQVVSQLRSAWYGLEAAMQSLALLRQDQQLIQQVASIAADRYRVGGGSQQDVLKAQLERTQLLEQIEQTSEQRDELQAEIKTLLNRPPHSPDLVAGTLTETPLPASDTALLTAVPANSPDVAAGQQEVEGQALRLDLARDGYKPDFTAGFMYLKTGAIMPDNYQFTLGVRVPLFWKKRQRPAIAEAAARLDAARRGYEDRLQQVRLDVRRQWLAARSAERILRIEQDGLIPQAEASFRAGMAEYQSNRLDFESLLSSFEDVLGLRLQYWQTLAQHEAAISRIERATGPLSSPPTAKEEPHAQLPH